LQSDNTEHDEVTEIVSWNPETKQHAKQKDRIKIKANIKTTIKMIPPLKQGTQFYGL